MRQQVINTHILIKITLISILTVLAHWNIWSIGVYAIGWNTTLFWLSVCYLAWINDPSLSMKRDWQWILPIMLTTLSFSLFENLWLKLISCFLLPLVTALFYGYSQIINRKDYYWNVDLINALCNRVTLPLHFIDDAWETLSPIIKNLFGESKSQLGKRIIKGVLILLPIAALVLVLLSSADQAFSHIIETFGYKFFLNFSWTFFAKILCIVILIFGLVSSIHAWQQPIDYDGVKSDDIVATINIDSVVAGIVIAGITAIYGLFLWLQLEHLIVDSLPIDFTQAEQIVKSGFWQLFFLSTLNVALFFIIYKNTTNTAQIILRIFIVASGFLLLSAAWRMSLYVYYYGLSHEKFFASYTTIFALFVFIYLVIASFQQKRKNIFRFIAFCSLWSYGIATILPIEKIILNTNVQLAESNDTRINLIHLQALSVDVLKDIQELREENATDSQFLTNNDLAWNSWLIKKKQYDCTRAWYEKNLSLVLNCH